MTGYLQKGVTWPNPRFTDNGDGTVTDNLTGLVWLKNAKCAGTKTWADALTWVNALGNGTCGLSDVSSAGSWRLPNIKELQSIIDFKFVSPALSDTAGIGQWTEGSPFSGVMNSFNWSSSTYNVDVPLYAWTMAINTGGNQSQQKNNSLFVWAERN